MALKTRYKNNSFNNIKDIVANEKQNDVFKCVF